MNRAAIAMALAGGLLASPLMAQKKVEEIVARVNNSIILKSELDREMRQLNDEIKQSGATGAEAKELFEKMSKDVLRNLIDVALLQQVAKEQDVDCQGPVAKRLDEIRQKNKLKDMDELEKLIRDQGLSLEEVRDNMCRDFVTQEVINREVASRIVISTEEMRKFYEEHKEDFKREAGIELGEIGILLKNGPEAEQRKKIDEIYMKLQSGEDFGELAARYSDTPSAINGGDVGFIFKEDFPNLAEDLLEAISKLEKGQISNIIVRPEGFIILKVLDKHEGGQLSFELAQNDIYSAIISQRLPGRVREYLEKQRNEGFVEVHEGYSDTGSVTRPGKPEKSAKSKDKKN
ncbi:MAG TPA: peptidylprolyl isomerase [Terriglobia bacterium]|nr:peptidylprolyl isomerase [Terriglobia bacterium]